MYYTVIYNDKVIDALDELVYLKYQDKYDRMVFCNESEAQAIFSSDGEEIWHVEGLYNLPVSGYDTVRIEKIDKYEYKQLKALNYKSEEEVIDKLFYSVYSDPATSYIYLTNGFKAYLVKENGEEILIDDGISCQGFFVFSTFENGEYEFVVKNYNDSKEVLREKVFINDILTVDNPVIADSKGWGLERQNSGEFYLEGYQGEKTNKLIIPLKVDDMLTSVIEHGSANNTFVEKLIIPEGITVIYHDSFRGCTNLKDVYLPHTITSINYGTFSGCSFLQSIIIPKTVGWIGDDAFERLHKFNKHIC